MKIFSPKVPTPKTINIGSIKPDTVPIRYPNLNRWKLQWGIIRFGRHNLVNFIATYDFPLPEYSHQLRPPNEKKQWYVEISDASSATPNTSAGISENVTLVERVSTAEGKFMLILHRESGVNFALWNDPLRLRSLDRQDQSTPRGVRV